MYFMSALNLFNKELRILNEKELTANYTEQELKSAYRRLAKKYHSDNYPNLSESEKKRYEEKFKEVNNAHEALKKHLTNNVDSHSYNNYDENFENLKKEYIRKMKFFNNATSDDETRKAHNDIVILMAISEEAIKKAVSKKQLEEIYKTFLDGIKKVYDRLKKKYFEDNLIEENMVFYETLNYNCNLDNFYNQLKKMRQKYSPLVKIEKEALVYEVWAGYERLKVLVDVGVKNAKINAKRDNSDINKIIEEMHKEIKEVFELYYKTKEKINSLKNEINSIPIKQELEKIEQDFNKGFSFSEIERRLTELEIRMVFQERLEKQKSEMNIIYARVLAKANSKIEATRKESHLEFDYINDCLIKVGNIFIQARKQLVDVEIISKLGDLTFHNLEIDRNILTFVERALEKGQKAKEEKQNENILFVKEGNFKYYDEENYIHMIVGEKDGKYEMVRYQSRVGIMYNYVTKEELERDFVPLDKYLNKGYELGTWKSIWDINEYYLYKFGIRGTGIIYVSEDTTNSMMQVKVSKFAPNHIIDTKPITNREISKWQNPEYLKEQLIRTINEEIKKREELYNNRTR